MFMTNYDYFAFQSVTTANSFRTKLVLPDRELSSVFGTGSRAVSESDTVQLGMGAYGFNF